MTNKELVKLFEEFEKIHNNGGLIEVWKDTFDEFKENVYKLFEDLKE